VLFFPSCKIEKDRLDVNISHIDIKPIKIKRYEQKLFQGDPANLSNELKKVQTEYKVFLDGDLEDSASIAPLINYVQDTLLQNVYQDCQLIFSELNQLEEELTQALKHYRYYYPEEEMFEVFSYVSGFDYQYPVQIIDRNFLIALDMYLGQGHFRYKSLGLPSYFLRRFDKSYIVRDCMMELAKSKIDYKNIGLSLLDMMINEGKIQWFTNAMVPEMNDSILMNYTTQQMEWADRSEGMIWAFLIENEFLYSKDNQVLQKFIAENPFTSYFGNESSPRLGRYIGYKIVDAYMQNNKDISLQKLMNNYDSQEILKKSGYKPGR
jgi:hypothetical protein